MVAQLVGVYDGSQAPQIPLRTAYRNIRTRSSLGSFASFADTLVEASVVDHVVMLHVAMFIPMVAYAVITVLSRRRGVGGKNVNV